MPDDRRFDVEFYRDDSGDKPVAEILREWNRTNRSLAARAKEELKQLSLRLYHGSSDTKALRGTKNRGLCELRVRGDDDARIIFFYESDRRIIVVHAFEKKRMGLSERELETARLRKRRHEERRTAGGP